LLIDVGSAALSSDTLDLFEVKRASAMAMIVNTESDTMKTIFSYFFKNRIRCVFVLVALGAVLMAVQQGLSWINSPVVPDELPTLIQTSRVAPSPVTEAAFVPMETAVAVMPRKSPSVSAKAKAVTLGSIPTRPPVTTTRASSQVVAPPLSRAVPAPASVASSGAGSSGNSAPSTVAPPLAFTVDPKNLTPEEQTALAKIQDDFLKATEDPHQNPADPVYRKRWMDAQFIADQTFKAMFGWSAFSRMQLDRAMHSYSEIQSQ